MNEQEWFLIKINYMHGADPSNTDLKCPYGNVINKGL